MVEIVVLGATKERDELARRPREIVADVRFNSLEKANKEPNVELEEMGGKEDGTEEGANAETNRLQRMSILCGHAKRSYIARHFENSFDK